MTPTPTVSGHELDTLVRRLDPTSVGVELTAREARHRDDLKARILMSAAESTPTPQLSPEPRRRTGRRRAVAAGLGVAAVTAAGLVVPQLFGEERRPSAWSATPTALSADAAREAGEACLSATEKLVTRPNQPPPEGSFAPEQRRAMRVVVSERRGPYDLVVLANEAGFDLTCTSYDGGDPMASGSRFPLTDPEATSVSVTGHAETFTSNGGPVAVTDGVTVVAGRVGAQVRGVTLLTPAGEVSASLSTGWFAASWPAWSNAPEDPFATVEISMTLADGTTTDPAPFASFPQRDVPAELGGS
ncbi:hypothetical protein BCF74_12518 [Knoellia remsis]|uniref:Uncharacterized protein n=1 Tax=Knoellia remsis TaxID=407159 RepID=A0A2T0U871_9MICO|nr:hypothetical protein [Knoellia remsis]PRY54109.1 hypothetical protein BCF74_12518 [Knoellia remsis]